MIDPRRLLRAFVHPRTAAERRGGDLLLLALLLVIALLRGLVWIGSYPVLKITDEPAHFDNIQYRAEHGFRPAVPDGSKIDKVLSAGASPELVRAWNMTNYYWRYRFLPYKHAVPEELELSLLAPTKQNRTTQGQNTSILYPGFYYTLGAVPYRMFRTASVLVRIFAVRVYSLCWGLLLVTATFFAARWSFDSRALAFAAGLFVNMQPMAAQQLGAINNDAGVIGLGAIVFLLQLAILRRLPRPPAAWLPVLLALVLGLAIETKPHAYALVPGTILLFAAMLWTAPRARRTWIIVGLGAITFLGVRALCQGLLDAPVAQALATPPATPANPAMIIPPPSFLSFLDSIDDAFVKYLFTTAWGSFCWLDATLSDEWLEALRLVGRLFWVGVAVATGQVLLRPTARLFWDRRAGIFAAFTAFTGLLTILYAEHLLGKIDSLDHVVQGRALLIVAPAIAIVGAIALGSLVPRRLRTLATTIAVCMIILLAFGSLLTVVSFQYVG